VIVRTGAPKPDISSADAFKRALLNAKSISYAKEGATGIYLESLFKRLGITEQMKPKTKFPPTGRGAQFVAEGETELMLSAISTFEPVPGAELLGPLPPELQSYIGYSAGVGTAQGGGGRQGPHQFLEGASGRSGAQGERHGAHHSVMV
jgi:molybdate transport system substrate-binding protein